MSTGHPIQTSTIKFALGWATVLGLWILAFWQLIIFDPQDGIFRPTEGIEGVLYEPTGQAPLPILVLVAWMVWRRRGHLIGPPAPEWKSRPIDLVSFAGAAVIAAWATHAGAPDLLVFSLQLVLLGAGGSLGGIKGRRAMFLPVLTLLLAVPIPAVLLNQWVFDLQVWTAQTGAAITRLFGQPAQALGVDIVTPRAVFRVIEACTGVAITTTLLMATVLYVELFYRTTTRSLVLLACVPLVAICVNLVRVLTIMGNPYSEVVGVHATQGIVMVVVGVLVVVGVDDLMGKVVSPARRSPGPIEAPAVHLWGGFIQVLVASGVLLLAVLLTPRFEPEETRDGAALSELPRILFGQRSNGLTTDVAFLGSVSFTDRIDRGYGDGSEQVRVFVGENSRINRRGSILSDKTSYPGSGWHVIRRETIELDDGLEADLLTFQSVDQVRQELHWRESTESFWIELFRNFVGLDQSRFSRRSGHARVFRIGVELPNPSRDRRETLMEYASAIRSPLQASDLTTATTTGTTRRYLGN